jgi:hypothetical protein
LMVNLGCYGALENQTVNNRSSGLRSTEAL